MGKTTDWASLWYRQYAMARVMLPAKVYCFCLNNLVLQGTEVEEAQGCVASNAENQRAIQIFGWKRRTCTYQIARY